jgi:hypothetical protein
MERGRGREMEREREREREKRTGTEKWGDRHREIERECVPVPAGSIESNAEQIGFVPVGPMERRHLT